MLVRGFNVKKKNNCLCIAIFNVLIIVAFIFSNIYIWDFINNLTSQWSHDSSGTAIPIININGLQVTGGTIGWTSEGIQIPRPLPTVIPNYPFIVFWVAMMGNLVLITLILRNPNKKSNSQP